MVGITLKPYSGNIKPYVCRYCGAEFYNKSSLGGHVTKVHTNANLEKIIKNKKELSDKK